MDDFACIEDWDLEAVVRGCNNYEGSPNSMEENPFMSFFAPLNLQQADPIFCFPSIFETTSVFDELEELYKPFYPVLHPSLSPQTPTSVSVIPQEIKDPEPEKLQSGSPVIASSPSSTPLASTHASKYKRSKKNQHKRMVMQVMANGLSSDMWAWRKYGQKPIKGSPYPRSYYRCSSSKGCLARKQVERSCSDPGMLIITYTAEHSHAHPTRRNSLAGSTRNRLSSPPKKPTSSSESNMVSDNNNCCPNSSSTSAVLSPTTPLMAASMEGEFMQHGRMQESIKKEEEQMPNIRLSEEDFIPSLEDLDGLVSELAFDGCFSDQFPDIYQY